MTSLTRGSLVVSLAVAAAVAVPGRAAASSPPAAVSGSWLGHATLTPTPNPAVIGSADNGRGHASHIGVFRVSATEIDNLLTGAVENGAFTLTTPPGDVLSGTYSGVFAFISATVGTFHTTGAITGGTGRFAGASGPVTFTGTADSVTLQIHGAFTATLS